MLLQYAHSIFQNGFLGRIQFKICANLRIIVKKIAQKVDLLAKKAHSIQILTGCVL